MKTLLLSLVSLLAFGSSLSAQHPWSDLSPEMQIRLAVQAAPPEARDGATVQGWDDSGAFVTLREGSNSLVCMAPNPERETLEVSCHHRDLEPYFARGRELSAQGITGNERVQARWEEFTAGELPIPFGTTNHILVGSGLDPESGEIQDPFLRWVVYTPNATPESTGLPARPGPATPWLMFPGTPGAHIMFTPPDPRSGG
ncbi:MAG: hypothetical protein P8188_01665 [Gemmatimonadota bacterium]